MYRVFVVQAGCLRRVQRMRDSCGSQPWRECCNCLSAIIWQDCLLVCIEFMKCLVVEGITHPEAEGNHSQTRPTTHPPVVQSSMLQIHQSAVTAMQSSNNARTHTSNARVAPCTACSAACLFTAAGRQQQRQPGAGRLRRPGQQRSWWERPRQGRGRRQQRQGRRRQPWWRWHPWRSWWRSSAPPAEGARKARARGGQEVVIVTQVLPSCSTASSVGAWQL